MSARRPRYPLLALALAASLLGCTLLVRITPTPPPPTRAPATALAGTARVTTTPAPGRTPTPQPPPATPVPDFYITTNDVSLYPGPVQYAGDQVSVQVIAHGVAKGTVDVVVGLSGPGAYRELGRGQLSGATMGGDAQAVFEHVWDTSGAPGVYTLTVQLDPSGALAGSDANRANDAVSLPVDVRPASELPANEIGARWVTTTTVCCVIHYVTGTAVERDLPEIAAESNAATAYVEDRLGAKLRDRLQIYFLSKVLGHGGFAGGEVSISYLDRDYPAGDLTIVLRHESTHVLDSVLSDQRIAFLGEGLAVYIAGGHFKPEPIDQRAAELVRLGRYIPLRGLANDFYLAQHETGYLEGAAFISYLVERYGWAQFARLYAAAGHAEGAPADQLDSALRQVYGVSLEQAEADWLAALGARPPDPAEARDLADTLRYFDDVRAYQQAYDPTAYFLRAWLPSMPGIEQAGDVGFSVRHPRAPENIALETMLIEAVARIGAGDYARAEDLLAAVEGVVASRRFDDQPLAAAYLAVVQAAAAQGYEAQHISLAPGEQSADILAVPADVTGAWPALTELRAEHGAGGWTLAR